MVECPHCHDSIETFKHETLPNMEGGDPAEVDVAACPFCERPLTVEIPG